MQLNLVFLEVPSPSEIVWETLKREQRAAVLEGLVRLIVEAAKDVRREEENDDD